MLISVINVDDELIMKWGRSGWWEISHKPETISCKQTLIYKQRQLDTTKTQVISTSTQL